MAFTGQRADDPPIGGDDGERGPRAGAERAPHLMARVGEHGVLDLVAPDRVPQRTALALAIELGAVDAHERDGLTGPLVLEPRQVGQHVHAVDAAEAPEVEDHHLALQLALEGQGRGHVQPERRVLREVLGRLGLGQPTGDDLASPGDVVGPRTTLGGGFLRRGKDGRGRAEGQEG